MKETKIKYVCPEGHLTRFDIDFDGVKECHICNTSMLWTLDQVATVAGLLVDRWKYS